MDLGLRINNALLPIRTTTGLFATTYEDRAEGLVQNLYLAVLDRRGSAEEVAGWRQQLADAFWCSLEQWNLEVESYYELLLGREADAAGCAIWVARLQAGADPNEVVAGFLTSQEYRSRFGDNAAFVRSLYQQVLGRDADQAGLDGWLSRLAAGAGDAEVVRGISASREATERALDSFYVQYLHREADEAGWAAWLLQVEQGHLNLAQVGTAFLASQEFAELSHGPQIGSS